MKRLLLGNCADAKRGEGIWESKNNEDSIAPSLREGPQGGGAVAAREGNRPQHGGALGRCARRQLLEGGAGVNTAPLGSNGVARGVLELARGGSTAVDSDSQLFILLSSPRAPQQAVFPLYAIYLFFEY